MIYLLTSFPIGISIFDPSLIKNNFNCRIVYILIIFYCKLLLMYDNSIKMCTKNTKE